MCGCLTARIPTALAALIRKAFVAIFHRKKRASKSSENSHIGVSTEKHDHNMADYKTIASNMIKLSPVTHFPTEIVDSDTPDSTPPTRQRNRPHSYHTRYQKKHRAPLHVPPPEARFYPIQVSRDPLSESEMSGDVNMSVPARVVLLQCGSYNPITNMHLRMFELARDCLHRTGRYRVIGGIMSPVNDEYSKKMEEENKEKDNAKFQVKMKELVSSKDRCAMIRLALKSLDWVRLDTWECEQPEWLETLKILRHHKEILDSAYNANPLPDTPNKKRKIDPEYSTDETDYSIPTHTQAQNVRNMNMNEGGPIQIKLLCGADLLESFATPGLWKPQDIEEIVSRYGIIVISRAGSDPERFIYENDVLYRYQNNITIVTEWIYNEISSTKIRRALRRGESVRFLIQDDVISYIKDNGLYSCPDK